MFGASILTQKYPGSPSNWGSRVYEGSNCPITSGGGGAPFEELVISIDVSTDEETDAEETDDAEAVDGSCA